MIDREKFRDTFQYYDHDVIINIIAIYENELPVRLEKIANNIKDKDYESLAFNTHSLKSITGSFLDPDSTLLARTIEKHARDKNSEGLDDLFSQLKIATEALAKELADIRRNLDKEPHPTAPSPE